MASQGPFPKSSSVGGEELGNPCSPRTTAATVPEPSRRVPRPWHSNGGAPGTPSLSSITVCKPQPGRRWGWCPGVLQSSGYLRPPLGRSPVSRRSGGADKDLLRELPTVLRERRSRRGAGEVLHLHQLLSARPPAPTCCGRIPAGPGNRRVFPCGGRRGAAPGALLAAATSCTRCCVTTGVCRLPGAARGGCLGRGSTQLKAGGVAGGGPGGGGGRRGGGQLCRGSCSPTEELLDPGWHGDTWRGPGAGHLAAGTEPREPPGFPRGGGSPGGAEPAALGRSASLGVGAACGAGGGSCPRSPRPQPGDTSPSPTRSFLGAARAGGLSCPARVSGGFSHCPGGGRAAPAPAGASGPSSSMQAARNSSLSSSSWGAAAPAGGPRQPPGCSPCLASGRRPGVLPGR